MRLSITALCLLLLNLKSLALAEDANTNLIAQPELTSKAKKVVPNNKPAENSSNGDDDRENDGESGYEKDDDDEKVNDLTVKKSGNTKIPQNDGADTVDGVDISKTMPKKEEPIDTTVETPESVEEPNQEDSAKGVNDSNNAFIEASKDVTEHLYNAISGMATANITLDAWKNQSWANKTPREVVDMIENEIFIMLNDKYVHFIFIAMSLISVMFTLYVAQQIIEHPKGAISKFCRCTIACLRIVCCPIYTILCCPCCTTKKNRPNTKEYSHLPLHDENESKIN